MSESQEYRLAQSLVWSKQDFSLAEFVEQYQLPQVVLVEVGYCGVNERTTFSGGQILTLHTLRTTSKIVCQVPHSNAVVVPTSFPLKAEVIPMDCRDTIVTAHQLSTIYQKIKYVRVMEVGSTWNNNSLATLKINDILQIKKIDTKSSVIRCQNLTTAQDVSILIDSTAVFVPLLDSNTYNLAEVQKKFGLPAKVRFLDKRAEIKMRSVPGKRNPSKSSTNLSDLGQMTAIEEIQDSDVIVTTVCSNLKEKVCLNVPMTLDIRVTVAEGFLQGDETYQKVVKTLDKQFNRTDLKAFDDLDIYGHVRAVNKTIEDMGKDLSVEDASPDVVEHAREHLQRVERQKSKKALPFEKRPKVPPRGRQPSTGDKPPPRPPKPGPKPDPKPQKNPGNILTRWVRKQSSNKSPTNEDPPSEDDYEDPFDRPYGLYASIDDINEEKISRSSVSEDSDTSEYTELDSAYKSVSQKPYAKLLRDPPKGKQTSIQSIPLPPPPTQTRIPPPLPATPPPQTRIPPPLPTTPAPQDKQAIYEAIARYPLDLSGLSVAEVKRLLRYLGMGAYMETFENELIDGPMLMTLDQESLESLNVQTFHCKKLLRFIGGWRPNV